MRIRIRLAAMFTRIRTELFRNLKFPQFLPIFLLICLANCQQNVDSLSQIELEAKYGQERTTFGDGRSCYRECDGTSKICYFKFKAENFNTMGARCDDCGKNVTSDCFNSECIIGNGIARNVLTINRQIPGPMISACLNDEIIIDVKNSMSGTGLSLHWHGLHQIQTPWMDGVPLVTQCAIPSGTTFRYKFYAEQVGTHYYHSHSGLQRTDGLFGRFVVRQPKADDPNGDLYDFDENQHSVLITDWKNSLASEFAPGLPGTFNRVDSVMINGIGCYTDPINGTTNCDMLPVSTFYMQYGKAYRWRIDNSASQNCPLELTFEGHNMTIIASDGFAVHPTTIDTLISMSGERYDVIVYAQENRKIKEVLVRVRAIGICTAFKIQAFGRIIFVEDHSNYQKSLWDMRPILNRLEWNKPFNVDAIIMNNPMTDCGSGRDLCVADLEQKNIQTPSGGNLREIKPNRVIPIRYSIVVNDIMPSHFLATGTKSMMGHINNIVSTTPSVPGLTQDDSFIRYCNANDFPANRSELHFCTHLIHVELNEVVDFVLHDDSFSRFISHPFHLHGHGFQVIDMGTREQFESNSGPYANSIKPPIIKDTLAVPGTGYAIIRFNATNPGYWYFHCHFEWHMHIGMRAIVRVGNKSDMKRPPKDFPTCGDYLPPIFES